MVSRITTLGSCLALLTLAGGCPQTAVPPTDNGVDARIGISATRGPAPLTVSVTAVDSSSRSGDIVSYAWDLAGQSTSDEVTAVHTFAEAGRHTITLRVRDSAGPRDRMRYRFPGRRTAPGSRPPWPWSEPLKTRATKRPIAAR